MCIEVVNSTCVNNVGGHWYDDIVYIHTSVFTRTAVMHVFLKKPYDVQ